MKIKFDIKYRQQVECGKYKVINHEGKPVTIERWDLNGSCPILAILPTLISDGESSWLEDRPYIYTIDGHCPTKISNDKYYQLYIETGDNLTASERMLYNLVNDHVYNRDSIDEDEVREWMKEIFLPALIEDSSNMEYMYGTPFKEIYNEKEHYNENDLG